MCCGQSTAFYVDPRDQIVMVYLTQLLPSHSYPIRRQMRIAINAAVVSPNTSRQEAGKIRSQAVFQTALSVCAAGLGAAGGGWRAGGPGDERHRSKADGAGESRPDARRPAADVSKSSGGWYQQQQCCNICTFARAQSLAATPEL